MGPLVRAPSDLAALTSTPSAGPTSTELTAATSPDGVRPAAGGGHGKQPGRLGGDDVHMGPLVRAPSDLAALTSTPSAGP
ncbi:hypothetical protein ABZ624_13090, partial [Streptomyces sp. NPDC007205]